MLNLAGIRTASASHLHSTKKSPPPLRLGMTYGNASLVRPAPSVASIKSVAFWNKSITTTDLLQFFKSVFLLKKTTFYSNNHVTQTANVRKIPLERTLTKINATNYLSRIKPHFDRFYSFFTHEKRYQLTLKWMKEHPPFRSATYRLAHLAQDTALVRFDQSRQINGLVITYPPSAAHTSCWRNITHAAHKRSARLGKVITPKSLPCIEVSQNGFKMYLVHPDHLPSPQWLKDCQLDTILKAVTEQQGSKITSASLRPRRC